MEQSGVPRTREASIKGTLIITIPHWPHSNPVISMPSLRQCVLEQGQQMTTRIIRVFGGGHAFGGTLMGEEVSPGLYLGSIATLIWGVRGIWRHSLKLQQLNWSPHPSHSLVPFCGRVFSATSWGGRANTMVISISQVSKLSLMWAKWLPRDHRQNWA